MVFVAVATYITGIGDIYKLDLKYLLNLAVITALGLVVAEITKYLNTNK